MRPFALPYPCFYSPSFREGGDIKQAGGAFVLGPGNSCDFVHRSAYAGDHPDLRELLAAATGKLPDGQDFTYPSASYWGARLDVNARAGSAATAQLEPGSNPPKPPNGGTASDRGAGAGERGAARLYRHAWPPWSLQLINLSGTAAMIAAASFTIAVVKFFFLNDAFKALCFLFLSAATWLLDPWAPPDVRNTFLDFVVSAITTSAAATSEGSTSSAETKNDLVLYTPKDIDAMAVSSGVIECDCSFIATTDVTSVIAEAAAAARAASVEGRSTSAQSDDGGDSDGYMTEAVARTRTFSVSRSAEAPPSPSDPSGAGLGREPAPAAIVPTVNAEDIREYQEAICYFREFLAKGHADLGRRGPICPFVPKALKQDLLYLSVVRTGGNPTSVEQVEDAAKQFLVRYSQLEPTQGRLQVYKAVLLIFPDVSLARASECIDQVQATLKPEFVRQGLMIGEFHKNNNASGLRNPEFFPLRTPTPCLAIRRIVATDLAFLDLSKYAVDVREEFLECYLKQFDPSAAGQSVFLQSKQSNHFPPL